MSTLVRVRRQRKDLSGLSNGGFILTMTRWPKNRMWCMGLFLTATLLLLIGCENSGNDNCGGIDDIVSCVTASAVPEDTSNVDAFRDADCNDDGVLDDPETFTDHNAQVTLSNDPFLTASDSLAVTIRSVTVFFTRPDEPCPGAACPPLDDLTDIAVNRTIPPGQSIDITLPMVDLQTKFDYEARGGDPTAVPRYIANYVFRARTEQFQDNFTIETSTSFTIGDFDNCGG